MIFFNEYSYSERTHSTDKKNYSKGISVMTALRGIGMVMYMTLLMCLNLAAAVAEQIQRLAIWPVHP